MSSRPAPPLRQKLREVAVEAMLDAAERCMIRNGFEQTTMQQIASEAGCAAGTLYLYFKSKDEILQAICVRHGRAIHEQIIKVYGEVEDPIGRYRAGMETFLRYANEQRLFFQLFLNAMPLRHRHFHRMLDAESMRQHETMANLELEALKEAQKQGTIRTDIAAELMQEFTKGLCINLFEHLMNTDPPVPVEQQIDLLWKLTIGGIGVRQ